MVNREALFCYAMSTLILIGGAVLAHFRYIDWQLCWVGLGLLCLNLWRFPPSLAENPFPDGNRRLPPGA